MHPNGMALLVTWTAVDEQGSDLDHHGMMSTKKPVGTSEDYLASLLGRAKNSSRLRDTNEITCVFDAYLTSF